MLIIFAGLPGTGKTTLARELANYLQATYLWIDSIEQAIAHSARGIKAEDEGYMVGYAVARDNLRLGRSVIADSVNPIHLTREAWREVARQADVRAFEVEVICSDVQEHKARVETRISDIPGLRNPSWQSVLEREYDDWQRDHIIIDTARKSITESLEELLSQLR